MVNVRQVKTQSEMEEVYRMTHDTFVEKELCDEQGDQSLKNNLKLDQHPDTQVFIALIDGEIRGTISLSKHKKMEEIYNFSFIKKLLIPHFEANLPAFSGWRLATRGTRMERYLLTVKLLLHGHKSIQLLGGEQTFFCFIPTQLKAYKDFFPSGKILGEVFKKTEIISSKLVLMKVKLNERSYDHLFRIYERLLKRYLPKKG
ncbi:MAG: hypothetical protein AAF696_32385 [Bacteroidota bacterium]